MIHFNVPPVVGNELQYMEEAIKNRKICGDGIFTKKCSKSIIHRHIINLIMEVTDAGKIMF